MVREVSRLIQAEAASVVRNIPEPIDPSPNSYDPYDPHEFNPYQAIEQLHNDRPRQTEPSRIGEKAKEEVDRYLEEEALPHRHPATQKRVDILEWWKANEQRFYHIAQIARSVLAIPASSVPSERVFSKAGELLTRKRLGMKPEEAELQLFLHYNKERIPDYQM